jgi:O-methyltransferase
MASVLIRLWKKLLIGASLPVIHAEYFRSSTGREYKVGFLKKVQLAYRMAANRKRITTASHFVEHLVMATEILKIPKSVAGCVVECGSYKGGSATNLSLVCGLCNRELEIFDSFRGLPDPSVSDREHALVSDQEIHTYSRGAWSGTLDEVKRNISEHGEIEVCKFNVGYFENSLPQFDKKCALVFLDVDLVDSLKTCVTYLWPLLQDGCYLFTHEAKHSAIPEMFFDGGWWNSMLHCKAPGLIGAGSGLGLLPSPGGYGSALGYTVKNPPLFNFKVNPQLG